MPVQMPNANVTDNPPKPQPKIPRKQKAGNPSESVETSRPRRAIEPPAKYGYDYALAIYPFSHKISSVILLNVRHTILYC